MIVRRLAAAALLLVACEPVIYPVERTPPPAVPGVEDTPSALVEQLGGDEDERKRAADLLVASGPSAVPVLVEALAADEDWLRLRAAVVLTRMGPDAADATEALVQALSDRSPPVRRQAARALGRLGVGADRVGPALAVALTDPNVDVVEAARESLVRVGPGAVPDLIEGALSDDVITRFGSISALGELGPPAREAVPAVVESLTQPEGRLRSRAAWALGRILADSAEPVDREITRALVRALGDREAPVRYSAATALGSIGPAARAARPAIERALGSVDLPTGVDLETLAESDPAAAEAAAADAWIESALREALRRIGTTEGGT